MDKNNFEWELINQANYTGNLSVYTYRAPVIGGWLVRVSDIISIAGWHNSNFTVTFIADPEHKWELKS